jgi:hypothetical protein
MTKQSYVSVVSLSIRWALIERPNGLAFRCRERAADLFQKANDLARAAVSCNAMFGREADIYD